MDGGRAWAEFSSECAGTLRAWIEAEQALTERMQPGGLAEPSAGDHLLAAEAALQRAIVDFAAAHSDGADPTPIALELLRAAEAQLRGS